MQVLQVQMLSNQLHTAKKRENVSAERMFRIHAAISSECGRVLAEPAKLAHLSSLAGELTSLTCMGGSPEDPIS
jgi:hypothetical protein